MISAPSPAKSSFCKEIGADLGLFMSFFRASWPSNQSRRRFPGACALRCAHQMPSGHEQIRQTASHEQAIGIFVQAPVPNLSKPKDTLDDEKGMLNLGATLGFRPVLLLFRIAQWPVAGAFSIGEITGPGRASTKGFCLSTVGRVGPDTGFFPVQQVVQHLAVMDIGRCGGNRVNQFRLAVHANVRLHAEVPLVALFRRVHTRVPFLVPVVGRTRCADDGGINNGAFTHFQAIRFKVFANQLKQLFTQIMGFQKVPDFDNRRLVRRRLFAQVDAGKKAHCTGVVQGFFHGRIGEIEPVLKKMNPQHALQTDGPASSPLGLRVEGLDDGAKFISGNNPIHFLKKDSRRVGLRWRSKLLSAKLVWRMRVSPGGLIRCSILYRKWRINQSFRRFFVHLSILSQKPDV